MVNITWAALYTQSTGITHSIQQTENNSSHPGYLEMFSRYRPIPDGELEKQFQPLHISMWIQAPYINTALGQSRSWRKKTTILLETQSCLWL